MRDKGVPSGGAEIESDAPEIDEEFIERKEKQIEEFNEKNLLFSSDMKSFLGEPILDSKFRTALEYTEEYRKLISEWEGDLKRQLLHLLDRVTIDEDYEIEAGDKRLIEISYENIDDRSYRKLTPIEEVADETGIIMDYGRNSNYLFLKTPEHTYLLVTSPLFGSEKTGDVNKMPYVELDNPYKLPRATMIQIFVGGLEISADVKEHGINWVVERTKESKDASRGGMECGCKPITRIRPALEYLFKSGL
ncbi:hypothetical protein HQ544_01695 [Candidatus Falkowbacteria bacterium]|nr:hypothetical protein [Candidatus Falkowbacteria bacterium]